MLRGADIMAKHGVIDNEQTMKYTRVAYSPSTAVSTACLRNLKA